MVDRFLKGTIFYHSWQVSQSYHLLPCLTGFSKLPSFTMPDRFLYHAWQVSQRCWRVEWYKMVSVNWQIKIKTYILCSTDRFSATSRSRVWKRDGDGDPSINWRWTPACVTSLGRCTCVCVGRAICVERKQDFVELETLDRIHTKNNCLSARKTMAHIFLQVDFVWIYKWTKSFKNVSLFDCTLICTRMR